MKKVIILLILQLLCAGADLIYALETPSWKQEIDLLVQTSQTPTARWDTNLFELPYASYFDSSAAKQFIARLSSLKTDRVDQIVDYVRNQAQVKPEQRGIWNELLRYAHKEKESRSPGYLETIFSAIRSFFARGTERGLMSQPKAKAKANRVVMFANKSEGDAHFNKYVPYLSLYSLEDDNFILRDTAVLDPVMYGPPGSNLILHKNLVLITTREINLFFNVTGKLIVYRIQNNMLIPIQSFQTGRSILVLPILVLPEKDLVVSVDPTLATLNVYAITDNISAPLKSLNNTIQLSNIVYPFSLAQLSDDYIGILGENNIAIYKVEQATLKEVSNMPIQGRAFAMSVLPGKKNKIFIVADNPRVGPYAGDDSQVDPSVLLSYIFDSETNSFYLESTVDIGTIKQYHAERVSVLAIPDYEMVLIGNRHNNTIDIYSIKNESIVFVKSIKMVQGLSLRGKGNSDPIVITQIHGTNRILVATRNAWPVLEGGTLTTLPMSGDGSIYLYEIINDNLVFIKRISVEGTPRRLVAESYWPQKDIQEAILEAKKELTLPIGSLISEHVVESASKPKSIDAFIATIINENKFDIHEAIRVIAYNHSNLKLHEIGKIVFYDLLFPFVVERATSRSITKEGRYALEGWVKYLRDHDADETILSVLDQLGVLEGVVESSKKAVVRNVKHYIAKVCGASCDSYAESIPNWQIGLNNLVNRQLPYQSVSRHYFSPHDIASLENRFQVWDFYRVLMAFDYATSQAQKDVAHSAGWDQIAQFARKALESRIAHYLDPAGDIALKESIERGSSLARLDGSVVSDAIDSIQRLGIKMSETDQYETVFFGIVLPFIIANTTDSGMTEQAKDALQTWSAQVDKFITDLHDRKNLVSNIRDLLEKNTSIDNRIYHIAIYVSQQL